MTKETKHKDKGHGEHEGDKVVTIIIEGTPHEWAEEEISFAEVVSLEVPSYALNSEVTYSVSYERGPSDRPEAPFVPGASVEVKEGMVFHVSETGQS